MMKLILAYPIVFALMFSTTVYSALDRVIDFALLDEVGVFHQLSRYQHREAVALMSFDQTCASMPIMLAEYNSLVSEFSNLDIEFLLMDSADLGREALLSLGLNIPIL